MRSYRICVLTTFLLLGTPLWAQQSSSTATLPASDPQAVAVVQAAITALGGAAAIGQNDTWEFQGQLDGPIDSGVQTETINFRLPSHTIVVNGISRPAPRYVTPSVFLPVLIGVILLQESQDPLTVLSFEGPSTVASKPVNIVKFVDSATQSIAQIWVFDAVTGLPTRVAFEAPAQIGLSKTVRGMVDLSDYQAISGVMYPFALATYVKSEPPEMLKIRSLTASAITTSSQSAVGGAQ